MEIKLTEAEKIKISNGQDIYQILLDILEREEGLGIHQEHFWVVGLAPDYMLLFIELVALGTSNRFIVDPREVFNMAVHKHAKYVILAHNHPLGTLEPSEKDQDLTDQLMHAAELLNLQVIDHLIVTKTAFYSFSLMGLLSKLEKSKKYAVYFIEEEKLLDRGEKKGVQKERIKMAKNAINEGLPLDLIVKLTGLSQEEIEEL